MTRLLQMAASIKPREKSGSRTLDRYGFQIHVSILKILELHRSKSDYRAVFDHFDDLMIFDKSENPEKVSFYQIKSQEDGAWTLNQMTAKKGKGRPPVTFLGRLYHHMASFGQMVTCLCFISNSSFRLKLLDETETNSDHVLIRTCDLHLDEIAALKSAVNADSATRITIDGINLFVFERTIGLMHQDLTVKGRILELVRERAHKTEHIPVLSIYEAMLENIFVRTCRTQEFTTAIEFYDLKTLCRADIEAIFARAEGGKRFHESWEIIQRDLLVSGMNSRGIIKIRTSSISYIDARAAGKPGAASFNSAARKMVSIHQSAFDSCITVVEIAKKLDLYLDLEYEHRLGALYVEAFEAM